MIKDSIPGFVAAIGTEVRGSGLSFQKPRYVPKVGQFAHDHVIHLYHVRISILCPKNSNIIDLNVMCQSNT